jgi:hypothetical protein
VSWKTTEQHWTVPCIFFSLSFGKFFKNNTFNVTFSVLAQVVTLKTGNVLKKLQEILNLK